MTKPIQQCSQFFKWNVARLNPFGLVLAMLYVIITAFLLWGAWDAGADDKGRYVLLQLPLALQMALLDTLGLMGWFSGISWWLAYFIFVPATCVGLYYIGKGLTRTWQHNKLLALLLISTPFVLAYFWTYFMILLG